jgi:hypothetical protein
MYHNVSVNSSGAHPPRELAISGKKIANFPPWERKTVLKPHPWANKLGLYPHPRAIILPV